MAQSRFKYAGLWLAAAMLAAGLLYSSHTVRITPRRIRSIRQKQEVLLQMHDLQKIALAEQAAVRRFEDDASARPCSLKELAGRRADIRQRESVQLAGGWTLYRTEVVFNDTPFDAAGDFIAAAEACRPPWRVTECQFSTSPRAPAAGTVTLMLEALEKTGGGQ